MQTFISQIETTHIFIWTAVMFIASKDVMRTQRQEIVLYETKWRYRPFFAVIIFLPIILMAVFGRERSDIYQYMSTFRLLPSGIRQGWNYFLLSSNKGFTLFGLLIKQFFGSSETAYRMAIALVHSIPIIFVLRKYSENYLFSIYVFIASTMHLAWLMNGLRQFMAVTMIFATTPWIIKKKYIPTVLVILLAATFHRTALVMIPVVFIVQGKVWNWKTILFSFIMVGATYFFAQNAGAFDTVADVAGYSLNVVREGGDDGTNPIRVLVNAIPMVLAFISRRSLRIENDPVINICTNLSVITTGLYLVSMVTSGILMGRMPIYSDLYNLILLPHVIKTCFKGKFQTIVTWGAVGLYLVYYIFSVR